MPTVCPPPLLAPGRDSARCAAQVRAECTVSMAGTRQEVAAEWDQLRRHDVLFLLTLEVQLPPSPSPPIEDKMLSDPMA